MWYSSNTHTIWISKEIFEETDMEYNAKSIVHEMVHAFTSRSFENVKMVRALTQKLKYTIK